MARPIGMGLNLGAGGRCIEGWTNVDRVPLPGIDVVHDLDRGPWPFEDECADQIDAKDVFEHLNDAILFVTECWRILRYGGDLTVITTHYGHPAAYTDPTHKRFPTPWTFDFWVPGTMYYKDHNAAYGGVAFQKVGYDQAPGDRGGVAAQRFKLRKVNTEFARMEALRHTG